MSMKTILTESETSVIPVNRKGNLKTWGATVLASASLGLFGSSIIAAEAHAAGPNDANIGQTDYLSGGPGAPDAEYTPPSRGSVKGVAVLPPRGRLA